MRQHQGINKNTGRLKKGYKYTGSTLKSGIKEIKKTKEKKTCKNYLKKKINKNIKEYRNRKQSIAISYSQVKKEHPACKRVLRK